MADVNQLHVEFAQVRDRLIQSKCLDRRLLRTDEEGRLLVHD